jgi:hypothetical protein
LWPNVDHLLAECDHWLCHLVLTGISALAEMVITVSSQR